MLTFVTHLKKSGLFLNERIWLSAVFSLEFFSFDQGDKNILTDVTPLQSRSTL